MRIDIISIFPEFFTALDVSLLGKAADSGLVDITVHDLRNWTHDRHRSVDDTPFGGGAGMVMKPDVWGEALDEVSGDGLIIVPSPSGEVFTQAMAAELASHPHLVFACGRYEGIDARVAVHYGERVRQVSLGDYVLNGGEVATLAMIEAITRLVPGFMGNAESIVEESHSAGLLEYPAFTKPRTWRGVEVPEILLSGNHAAIERWRRDRALVTTAQTRPDLIVRLDPATLDWRDRELLATCGYAWAGGEAAPRSLTIRAATPTDAEPLAALAARTFPRACPPEITAEDMAEFIAENLRPDQWAERIGAPQHNILMVAESGGDLVGYTWAKLPRNADEAPQDPDIAAVVTERPQAELSKIYVDEQFAGSGIAGALFDATVAAVRPTGAKVMWLGTNARNDRARTFYKRHGMRKVGTRTFYVGAVRNDDVVFKLVLATEAGGGALS